MHQTQQNCEVFIHDILQCRDYIYEGECTTAIGQANQKTKEVPLSNPYHFMEWLIRQDAHMKLWLHPPNIR